MPQDLSDRVWNLEKNMNAILPTINEHDVMLKGPLGLDRTVRENMAVQTERDKQRDKAVARLMWAMGVGVPTLITLLEWHPWR